jgi:sterol desaturase/sphingolipid hydroxylase (fatty acid hydroxylase superfamily)
MEIGFALLRAAASFAVLAAIFVPLERLFPARPGQLLRRPGLALDGCFFVGQYLVWSGLALLVLTTLRAACDGAIPGALRAAVARQPLALQAIEVVALGDLAVYGWHRACHRFDLLWRFHAVHHSAEQLDWLAAHREHPLDGLTTQLAQNLPAFLFGFPLAAIAGLAAFRGAWGIFVHSNVRLPLGPLRFLVGAPELHHFHHARARETRNFANLAPWIDLVFGTYHRPEGEERYPLGLDEPLPASYLGQLVAPFRAQPRPAIDRATIL